jgi:hypothetical protein
MEYILLSVVAVVGILLYEYRLRKPGQIVISGTPEAVRVRRGNYYPRHFSLPIPSTTHAFTQTIEASAKGSIEVRVRLAVTVAPSPTHLGALVRIGGWSADALVKAAKELETVLLGLVKQHTERSGLEELTSDSVRDALARRTADLRSTLGLDVITLTVASVDAADPQIAEALRQREQARILERSEVISHQARIAAAKARLTADEEIALMEHEVELKRYDLKKVQIEKESALAGSRAEHELALKRANLDFERDELRVLRENPELLLLTPQAARLAEASQALKNARTVVSLSPNDSGQAGDLLGLFASLLQGALDTQKRKKEK